MNCITWPIREAPHHPAWPTFPTSSHITLHLVHHTTRSMAFFILLEHTEPFPISQPLTALLLLHRILKLWFPSSHTSGLNSNFKGAFPIGLTKEACSQYYHIIMFISFISKIFSYIWLFISSLLPLLERTFHLPGSCHIPSSWNSAWHITSLQLLNQF